MWGFLAKLGAGAAVGALVATWAPVIGSEARLDKLRADVADLRVAVGWYKVAETHYEQAIQQRDGRILALAVTEGTNYERLAKRCAGDAPVWFERGVAVGRSACAVASGGDVADRVRDARSEWAKGSYSGSPR